MYAFMRQAIDEARAGAREGGIPAGAILVNKDGKVIAKGRNMRLQENNIVMHCNLDCLRKVEKVSDCAGGTIITTLMPCYLCAGAIIQFGIKKVVVGDSKSAKGAKELLEAHGIEVVDMESFECRQMMEDFIRMNPQAWNEDIGKL